MEPLVIQSVEQAHRLAAGAAPRHPLVTVLGASWQPPVAVQVPLLNRRVVSELYSVSLKRGDECGLRYGRTRYDFQAGSLLFLAPGQSIVPVTEPGELERAQEGWNLLFHPDLIRSTSLGEAMREYTYFGYESHEALHVSEGERDTLTAIVKNIEGEGVHIDDSTDAIVVSHLQLLMNYCLRYYRRQFTSRRPANRGAVERLERFLLDYFESSRPTEHGLPTVAACAQALGYSPDYLSDLLRKETGRSTRDHIHFFLIERAKSRLLRSDEPVSAIAFSLGFECAQHFSRLFKNKTGMSPSAYRH